MVTRTLRAPCRSGLWIVCVRDLFISDPHAGHKRIIEYCARPFVDLDEMHETIVANWNAKVWDTDTVYILGDFYFGSTEATGAFLDRLRGHKVLIRGNHDWTRNVKAFTERGYPVHKSLTLQYGSTDLIFLQHKPLIEDHPDPRVTHILCGHVHNHWRRSATPNGTPIINVGVDVWNFSPHTYYELLGA